MPNKRDILTAVKNFAAFNKVPELKGAVPRLRKNGSPFVYTGGFNMVFQLNAGGKEWALRVWHVPMREISGRFKIISDYLAKLNSKYFADFAYDHNGLSVNGELVDTIRMEWLDGHLLKDYIKIHLNDKARLRSLADRFIQMCEFLRQAKISHGDLQEGNILVTESGELKLVDYDSICVPQIEGGKEYVTGLRGYQHPSRFGNKKLSLKADYFSELVIYLSIIAISEDNTLWDKYQVQDTQFLLFSDTDFKDYKLSEIYTDLLKLSHEVSQLQSILMDYLEADSFESLKPFSEYLAPVNIKLFKSEPEALVRGAEGKLHWKVENALSVSIEPGLSSVPEEGDFSIRPDENKVYTIKAKGFNSSMEKSVLVQVFPTPLIKMVEIPDINFAQTINLEISPPAPPRINLAVWSSMSNKMVSTNHFSRKIELPSYEESIEFLDLKELNSQLFIKDIKEATVPFYAEWAEKIRMLWKTMKNRQ